MAAAQHYLDENLALPSPPYVFKASKFPLKKIAISLSINHPLLSARIPTSPLLLHAVIEPSSLRLIFSFNEGT